jgi:hypothetical protein
MKKIKIMSLLFLSTLGLQASVSAGLDDIGIYKQTFQNDVFQSEKDGITWKMSLPAKNLNLIESNNNELKVQYSEKGWIYAFFDIKANTSENAEDIKIKFDVKGTDPFKIMIYSLTEENKDGPIALTNTKEQAIYLVDRSEIFKNFEGHFIREKGKKYRVYIHPQKGGQTGNTIIKDLKIENGAIPNNFNDEGIYEETFKSDLLNMKRIPEKSIKWDQNNVAKNTNTVHILNNQLEIDYNKNWNIVQLDINQNPSQKEDEEIKGTLDVNMPSGFKIEVYSLKENGTPESYAFQPNLKKEKADFKFNSSEEFQKIVFKFKKEPLKNYRILIYPLKLGKEEKTIIRNIKIENISFRLLKMLEDIELPESYKNIIIKIKDQTKKLNIDTSFFGLNGENIFSENTGNNSSQNTTTNTTNDTNTNNDGPPPPPPPPMFDLNESQKDPYSEYSLEDLEKKVKDGDSKAIKEMVKRKKIVLNPYLKYSLEVLKTKSDEGDEKAKAELLKRKNLNDPYLNFSNEVLKTKSDEGDQKASAELLNRANTGDMNAAVLLKKLQNPEIDKKFQKTKDYLIELMKKDFDLQKKADKGDIDAQNEIQKLKKSYDFEMASTIYKTNLGEHQYLIIYKRFENESKYTKDIDVPKTIYMSPEKELELGSKTDNELTTIMNNSNHLDKDFARKILADRETAKKELAWNYKTDNEILYLMRKGTKEEKTAAINEFIKRKRKKDEEGSTTIKSSFTFSFWKQNYANLITYDDNKLIEEIKNSDNEVSKKVKEEQEFRKQARIYEILKDESADNLKNIIKDKYKKKEQLIYDITVEKYGNDEQLSKDLKELAKKQEEFKNQLKLKYRIDVDNFKEVIDEQYNLNQSFEDNLTTKINKIFYLKDYQFETELKELFQRRDNLDNEINKEIKTIENGKATPLKKLIVEIKDLKNKINTEILKKYDSDNDLQKRAKKQTLYYEEAKQELLSRKKKEGIDEEFNNKILLVQQKIKSEKEVKKLREQVVEESDNDDNIDDDDWE